MVAANRKLMMKKTKVRGKSESDGAHPPGKSNKKRSNGDTAEDLMGVHLISNQDTERHFGRAKTVTDNPVQSQLANRPKADVHLQLDGRIWQEAETEAARLGMEMSEYLELALENFKNSSAK